MAKAELFILDEEFKNFAVLDTYESFIWTDRYYEAGDFEIVTIANEYYLSVFQLDYYIYFNKSEHLMVIEQIEIDSDAEDGNRLKVSGRSLESILDRRIIWGHVAIEDTLQNGVKKLLMDNAIMPSDSSRIIPGLIFKETEDEHIAKLSMVTQYLGESLYDALVDICKNLNIGFKIILTEDKNLEFSLYYSVFRNYDQTDNPYVIFSADYGNLINSNYICTTENYRTVTLIGGEGEGNEKKLATYELSDGAGEGLKRREVYTDASSVSSNVDDREMSPEEYTEELRYKGSETLADSIITESFEGETADTNYIYGRDYNIGDVVTLRNEYGRSSISRIIEYIFSKNASENKAYPTFVTVADDDNLVYRNFDENKSYNPGDRVMVDDDVMEAKEKIKPGPYIPGQWKKVKTKSSAVRGIVDLLYRTDGHLYNYDITFDYPITDYDFIAIISSVPYWSPDHKEYLKVRWDVEKSGGDKWVEFMPVKLMLDLKEKYPDLKTSLGFDNKFTKFYDLISATQLKVLDDAGGTEGTYNSWKNTGDDQILEIYGVGNKNFKTIKDNIKLIAGDYVNSLYNNNKLQLMEPYNNYDALLFTNIRNRINISSMQTNRHHRPMTELLGYSIYRDQIVPTELLDEILADNIANGIERCWYAKYQLAFNNGNSRISPINQNRMEFDEDDDTSLYNAPYFVHGIKFTKIEKIYGELSNFNSSEDIFLSKNVTDFDVILIVTKGNPNVSWSSGSQKYITINSFTTKELEYLYSCYKSGEGLVAKSGIIASVDTDGCYNAYQVTQLNKFTFIKSDNVGNVGVIEVYGVKY